MVEIKKTPDGIEIPPPGPDDVLYEKGGRLRSHHPESPHGAQSR